MASPLSEREIYWLNRLSSASNSGMYPGLHWDESQKTFGQLYQRGLIDCFDPPNPSHKMRAVINFDGREALKEAASGEA